ncbi:MAG: hypothetical protein FJ298_12760 [Planctomycetes bacterium]|nr:hypothetical protein [Planctomycetota bacterium]
MAGMLGAAEWVAPDWTILGYVLAIVGCVLLANGVLFRNPRALVAERLGRGPQPLRRVRDFVFHRVQVGLGFSYLVAAFASLLYGRLEPAALPGGSALAWVGLVLVATGALEVAGWLWSAHSVRVHVREVLRESPPDFETDPTLAREIGELFGVDSRADETVQSYAARLRQSLGLTTLVRQVGGARAGSVERGVTGFGDEGDDES